MFTKIHRESLPPQTAVPVRNAVTDAVAPDAPVEVTVQALPVRSRTAAAVS